MLVNYSIRLRHRVAQERFKILLHSTAQGNNHNERIPQGSAIKNNADGVPEGKPTILAASMCNEGLVSQY